MNRICVDVKKRGLSAPCAAVGGSPEDIFEQKKRGAV